MRPAHRGGPAAPLLLGLAKLICVFVGVRVLVNAVGDPSAVFWAARSASLTPRHLLSSGAYAAWDEDPPAARTSPREQSVTVPGRLRDRLQRYAERRLALWYAERVAGGSPERRYELAERLTRLVYPDYWFSEFGRTWTDDEDFVRWYEREEPHNRHSADRKYTLRELTKLVAAVPGSVAECGVYRGASAELMARGLPGRHLHLFDSFAGLSAPEDRDGSYWQEGDLAMDETTVRHRLTAAGVPHTVYKGWIPERFPEVAYERFALLHVDVDLFQPTRDSLEFFYPRLSPGAVVVLDDYGFASCPGVRQAVDELMADRPEDVVQLPTGQALFQKQ